MNPVLSALLWGAFSAASFPAGALVGLVVKVSATSTGLLIAFGAGALIFAVTVEVRPRAEASRRILWTRMQGPRSASPQPAPCSLTDALNRLQVPSVGFRLPLVLVPQDAPSLWGGRGFGPRTVAGFQTRLSCDHILTLLALRPSPLPPACGDSTAFPCSTGSDSSLPVCPFPAAVRGAAGAHQGRRSGPPGRDDRVRGGGGRRFRVHANQRRPAAVGQSRGPLAAAALQRRGARGARVRGSVGAHRAAAHAGHDSSHAGERSGTTVLVEHGAPRALSEST